MQHPTARMRLSSPSVAWAYAHQSRTTQNVNRTLTPGWPASYFTCRYQRFLTTSVQAHCYCFSTQTLLRQRVISVYKTTPSSTLQTINSRISRSRKRQRSSNKKLGLRRQEAGETIESFARDIKLIGHNAYTGKDPELLEE